MTDTPLLDRTKLDELHEVGRLNETPLVRILLTTYLDGLDAAVAGIQAAVIGCDRPAVALAAHALRSSSAQLGAARLAAVCLQIEQGTSEDAQVLLESLGREVEALRPVFETERDRV